MVTTIKVLKRKDGATIIVGVVVAMILWQLLSMVTLSLSGKLSGLDTGDVGYGFPGGWKTQYLNPVVSAALQLLLLEVVLWLYGMVHESMTKK